QQRHRHQEAQVADRLFPSQPDRDLHGPGQHHGQHQQQRQELGGQPAPRRDQQPLLFQPFADLVQLAEARPVQVAERGDGPGGAGRVNGPLRRGGRGQGFTREGEGAALAVHAQGPARDEGGDRRVQRQPLAARQVGEVVGGQRRGRHVPLVSGRPQPPPQPGGDDDRNPRGGQVERQKVRPGQVERVHRIALPFFYPLGRIRPAAVTAPAGFGPPAAGRYNGGMQRFMLKSKVHRATVTHADVDYEGSLTLDQDLLEAADIVPFEQVHVWNVTRGTRLWTYAMTGERGSGVVCVNGAAAHLVQPGDLVIVATFTELDDEAARRHRPRVVLVDERNRVRDPSAAEVAGPAQR